MLWPTHHGVLRVGLLVVHLSDLLLRGAVDLTQDAEPLAVTMRTAVSATRRTQWEAAKDVLPPHCWTKPLSSQGTRWRWPRNGPQGGSLAQKYRALLTWRPQLTLRSGGTSSPASQCRFRSPSLCCQRFLCTGQKTQWLLHRLLLLGSQLISPLTNFQTTNQPTNNRY